MTDETESPDDAAALQGRVLAWLADPATHGLSEPVVTVETGANTILLAGPTAWKVKRPVRLPYLDYSTLAKREAACRREVEINRPGAPAIYRGAVPITRVTDPAATAPFAFGGDGETVEWAVEMARFDETAALDRRLASGPPDEHLLARLARVVATAEARAPRRDAAPWIADLARYAAHNDEAFRARPDLFPPAAVAALTGATSAARAGLAGLLAERGRQGFVRLLHGDLHAGNVALVGGEPVLFDAIEFDDAVATGDVLYDAGFLVMDLDERGHRAAAATLLNRLLVESLFLDTSGLGPDAVAERILRHLGGLAALPFFLSMRAAIRAKVTALAPVVAGTPAAARQSVAARRYFDAARRYLEPVPPALVAVGGLSGTGKSTLARRLAARFGAAPGALHLRSDVVRKLLAGAGETERLPEAAYRPEMSRRVYGTLEAAVRTGLAAGRGVIVDAVMARPDERVAAARLAASAGVPFRGLWLAAPTELLERRVEARRDDASDAGAAVVQAQAGYDLGAVDWIEVDASGGPDETFARAVAALRASAFPLVSEAE